MYHADNPRDSEEYDRVVEPRIKPRPDDEVVVRRTPIVADSPESQLTPDSRRRERRSVDRMSTGI